MKPSRFPFIVCLLGTLFFYLPIAVLIVNSFNASRFSTVWEGFSLRWYRELFADQTIWAALRNTLIIAVSATAASMVLGTLAAFALHRYRSRLQDVHYTLVYTPLVMPDILMGIGLLLFFVALRIPLDLGTIFIAHVSFCISYVAMVVLARLQDFDFSLIEAAQDLGAGTWTVLWRVMLPLLAPGILAGGLLAFSLSIDDFVITYFVAGPGSTTLPIKIYSMIKYGKPPVINALSSLILCATFVLIWISQRLRRETRMKSTCLRLVLFACAALAAAGCGRKAPTLHVFMWSDYIDPVIVTEFQQKFGCKVVMDYYDSNESMYAKLKAGGTGYDVVFPSSYMVSIMQRQDMLLPLDHAKLPNLKHLDPTANRFSLDAAHAYSVPYMLGSSGIGYLTNKVSDFKASWSMFDNPAYKGRMTLMNDYRETIGAALKSLGFSLNTLDTNQLAQARDRVIQWKANIAKFESEQYKNGLVSAEFLVAHGYSGDIMQVMEENADIAYVVPEEGTSVALDEMSILTQAPQPQLAHDFINYLHEPDVAARNIAFVYYLCPNLAAYELVESEIRENPAVFLPAAILEKSEVVMDLGENNALYSRIWDQIKGAE